MHEQVALQDGHSFKRSPTGQTVSPVIKGHHACVMVFSDRRSHIPVVAQQALMSFHSSTSKCATPKRFTPFRRETYKHCTQLNYFICQTCYKAIHGKYCYPVQKAIDPTSVGLCTALHRAMAADVNPMAFAHWTAAKTRCIYGPYLKLTSCAMHRSKCCTTVTQT